ncbi:SDR family NAD(P)-dependent oxidoreductase [Carboxylicivirga sediminis]|uniref:SDR family NAD(P)-dependent oxidoreductase n=1 Tax=Carboxylicivirga sediminis TaxID=2006564 RepID=A0A941IXV5_9BACT|nr:SDR family NAD(P)-dependent oxidoreductase [Carboxylicivirga sediminis]MBR8535903.1 SDR family NAD(P)-dependent oxidoreductase [Carboxylicivirga sediminis]
MELIDILAITRMCLSERGLVICKGIVNENGKAVDSIEALKQIDKSIDANNCIQIDVSENEEQLIAELKQKISQKKEAVIAVVVKNKGAILVDAFSKESNEVVGNRIIIVTGGAQGFGGGVAEELFDKGAHVVVADLNEQAGQQMVDKLNGKGKNNKAIFIKTNVGDSGSVRHLIDQTVLQLGGVDAIISNAGILRAGGLDEMDPDTFDLMTKVNYTGYFYCAKHASRVMKLQALAAPEHYMDIIQVNSKSGLKGSNRNFAYAGGKFGGIGLTQSFALELMPHNIKVNSICPGNFFDGPLWSDPENGLFVQYLKAGKVPGAKSIADVQAHYEKQVPAGRGCRVKDVTKAIVYVIDQEYETGQAVPVTGGQEMLR